MTEVQLAYVIKAILKALFLLPGGPIFGALSGMLLMTRWRRLGLTLIVLSLSSLYLFSTPGVARYLLEIVEDTPPLELSNPQIKNAQAIVVLSSGREYAVAEYGDKDRADRSSKDRITYADWLRQKTGLPLLISGGMSWNASDSSSIAEVMANYLVFLGKKPPTWLEERSTNTAENAQFSAEILQSNNINTILLVTNASHMRRSIESFQRTGLTVVAAPMGYLKNAHQFAAILNWLPNIRALENSRNALHERVGRLWYELSSASE